MDSKFDKWFLRLLQLAEDEFLEAENIEQLSLGFNEIKSLNSSLLRVRALSFLNLTANRMTVFSLQEIHGLQRLKMVDLSYNRIARLGGRMEVGIPPPHCGLSLSSTSRLRPWPRPNP